MRLNTCKQFYRSLKGTLLKKRRKQTLIKFYRVISIPIFYMVPHIWS